MNPSRASLTRRGFLSGSAAAAAASSLSSASNAQDSAPAPSGGVAIASGNGLESVRIAYDAMNGGTTPVDAAVAGVNVVELDPKDTSVGYGGLPNEDGVVELDSAVMDGPTHNSGAVASIRNVKMPSKVALLVMRRTDHCMIVGDGAWEFARAHGFKKEELLTERARRIWLRWKENLSTSDDWLPPPPARDEADEDDRQVSNQDQFEKRQTGTIHCSARNASGDLGCVTTTSGLAFKIPGRVGDSPILGAGLYLDNEVGSAGSTGRGEAVILSCGSMAIVEQMRNGKGPDDACRIVLERIVDQSRRNGLVDGQGRPTFNVQFYAVDKAGRYAGAALWSGGRFAVCDSDGPRREPCVALFERNR